MYASGPSPPPHGMDVPPSAHSSTSVTPAPAIGGGVANTASASRSSIPPTAQGRKRKRAQAASTSHAASPAPSEPGSTNGNATGNDSLLASRADLYSRPMLSVSRGPVFIPISEGSEWFRTDAIGVNRVGYRYIPAGINAPGYITPCRTIESGPTSFRVSWEDRSPLLRVKKDGLSLAGFRGFRSARCNTPVREGKWYMEVKIINGGGDRLPDQPDSSKEGNHVRLGWGRREASLNGPVGLDGYTYGYRDKTGDKVTLSRPRPYGKPYKSGDVIGMYISLPPLRQPNKKDPHDPAHIHRERIPIDLKGQEVFEILEYPVSKEMSSLMDYSGKPNNSASVPSTSSKKSAAAGAKPPDRTTTTSTTSTKPNNDPPLRPLPTLPDSKIAFFVNGESQGVAFEDIYDFLPLRQTEEQKRKAKDRSRRAREGVKEHRENPFDDGTLGYYPMISLFNDAIVRINPGPAFEYPPPLDVDALLEGKPQPVAQPLQSTQPKEDPMKVDLPVKSEPEAVSLDVKMDVDEEKKPALCWRPLIERYPEFMKEQWALDAIEEEEAKIEFQKQMAKGDTAKTRKKPAPLRAKAEGGDIRKATNAKGGKKKKTTGESAGVGTPEPTPTPESSTAPSLKKAKKAAGQAALGVVASSHQATPDPSHTRSATETPFSTPPPPSVSSSAAAAAAAAIHLQQHQTQQHPSNLHQFHHALARSESASNRPSPSPLRQSTAYRESQGDKDDELPVTSSSSALPRPKKHPGSQKGRHHAQLAAAAAAAAPVVFSPGEAGGAAVGNAQTSSSGSRKGSNVSNGHQADDQAQPRLVAKIGAHRATTGAHQLRPASFDDDDDDDEDDLDEYLGGVVEGGAGGGGGTPDGYESSTGSPEADFEMRGDRGAHEQAQDFPSEGEEMEDDGDDIARMVDGLGQEEDGGTTDAGDADDRDLEMELLEAVGDETDEGDIGIEVEAQTASEMRTRSQSPA